MEKQSASNSKIKYTLLSILFSVLFIFTALKFSSPLTAYADDTLVSNSNGKVSNGFPIHSI